VTKPKGQATIFHSSYWIPDCGPGIAPTLKEKVAASAKCE